MPCRIQVRRFKLHYDQRATIYFCSCTLDRIEEHWQINRRKGKKKKYTDNDNNNIISLECNTFVDCYRINMKFELLPNELLLDLFEYLSIIDIIEIFSTLNNRFRTVIHDHHRKYLLNFQSISKRNFHNICQNYLNLFNNRIGSIRFSDNNETPEQTTVFFSYAFRMRFLSELENMVLSDIQSHDILEKFLAECSNLPFLTHLKLIKCHMSVNRDCIDRICDQIWNLKKLTHCYIDICFLNRNYFPRPNAISTSIKHLSIPNISCCFNELIHLFQHTPFIDYLSIVFVDYTHSIYAISDENTFTITHLKLSFESSLDILECLFKRMPNLFDLTLDICNIYMNGYQWETMIKAYLFKLKKFRFKMRFSSIHSECKENKLSEIVDTFRTKFWIYERQWFIRCHWYASNDKYSLDFIDIFTLPYAFQDFLSYTGCILTKSTCMYDNKYISCDCVTNLYYGSSSFLNSILSCFRFSNIQRLSLSLPFNEYFSVVVCKLDRLTSLYISINKRKKNDHIESQLQNLFDRAINLYSLGFGSWSSSCLSIPLINNSSQSVRCLDLQNFSFNKNWHYFTDEECEQLIHSPLGIQCEMLLIKIKNRKTILSLVHHMCKLRALNVRCEDDNAIEYNEFQDELVNWLKLCLPSSCVIKRDVYYMKNIRLWIR